MQKIYFVLALFLCATSSFGQLENVEQPLIQEPSSEIWHDNNIYSDQNAFGNEANKTRPRSPSPIPAPIDGGLVILLAAGAMYGKKRLGQQKRAKDQL